MADTEKKEGKEVKHEHKPSKSALKKGKKLWYPILCPQMFSNQVLGKTLIYNINDIMNKAVEANLMNLTGDMKNQNVNVGFRVTSIKNGQGITDVWSYTIIPGHIKKLIRRKRDKIDDRFILETKDGVKTIVKPMIISSSKTSRSIRADMRHKTQALLTKMFKAASFEDVMRDLIIHKTQSIMRKELNRVAPVKACEIRVLARYHEPELGEQKKVEEIVVVEAPKEEPKAEEAAVESPKPKKAKKAKAEKAPEAEAVAAEEAESEEDAE